MRCRGKAAKKEKTEMKKLVALVCSLILLVSGMALFAGCGADNSQDWEEIKEKGTLVVGCTIFKPITYQEGEEWKGFDVEVAQAVGEKLGVDVDFQIIDWNNKVIELNAKTVDCLWNGMTITDELEEQTSVTVPYMKNQQVVITQKANESVYTTKESLKDARVVAESGSAGAAFGREYSDHFTTAPSQLDIFINLIGNPPTADVGILDSVLAGYYLTEEAYQGLTMIDVGFEEEEYGIAFRKGSPVKDLVNDALKELYADGTITRIAEDYGLVNELIPIE